MAAAEVALPPPPPSGPSPSEASPPPPPSRFLKALSQSTVQSTPPEKGSPKPPDGPTEDAPCPTPARFRQALAKTAANVVEVPEVAAVSSSASPAASRSGAQSDPEPLVQELLDSTQDHDACLAACASLEAATARSSTLHRRVIAGGGVEALLAAMHGHREHPDIQLVACHALQHLAAAASCGGAARVAQAGGCAILLTAIAGPDTLLAQAAAHTLELVTFGGPVPRQLAVSSGAVETLLSALKAHRSAPDMHEAVLAALQAVIEKDPDCQQIERLAAANGIPLIVSSLGENRSNQKVQYWGRLLMHAVCSENVNLKAETLRKLHYQGIELEL